MRRRPVFIQVSSKPVRVHPHPCKASVLQLLELISVGTLCDNSEWRYYRMQSTWSSVERTISLRHKQANAGNRVMTVADNVAGTGLEDLVSVCIRIDEIYLLQHVTKQYKPEQKHVK